MDYYFVTYRSCSSRSLEFHSSVVHLDPHITIFVNHPVHFWGLSKKISHGNTFPSFDRNIVYKWNLSPGYFIPRRSTPSQSLWLIKIVEEISLSSYLCLVGNEGRIHWLTIKQIIPATPSNPTIPEVKRTSRSCWSYSNWF